MKGLSDQSENDNVDYDENLPEVNTMNPPGEDNKEPDEGEDEEVIVNASNDEDQGDDAEKKCLMNYLQVCSLR